MTTIHASCVALDGRGVLIRGDSGAGKSRLAHMLLLRMPVYGRTSMLVADDRVHIEARDGRLIARVPEVLAGLLEVRGLGLVRFPHAAEAPLAFVLDLMPKADIHRLPPAADLRTTIEGVTLPRAFASSPESGLDVMLTVIGEAGATLDPDLPLASVRIDGKIEAP